MPYFAHTLPGVADRSRWELLLTDETTPGRVGHLNRVAELCAGFAQELSLQFPAVWRECGWLLGMWHDLGKFLEAFQTYLAREAEKKGSGGRVVHARDGAFLAAERALTHLILIGDLLAYAIAGHHAGLQDGTRLFQMCRSGLPVSVARLDECARKVPEALLDGSHFEKLWRNCREEIKHLQDSGEACIASLPGFPAVALNPDPTLNSWGFAVAMQIRMLFSCLVDADFLATEAFMKPDKRRLRPSWPPSALGEMSSVLEAHLKDVESQANPSEINRLRALIHRACFEAGCKLPGVFQLNVPTGGGKTLASLSFALNHALQHGMRRVIYVIPYTSIIEQTAKKFRQVFAELSAAWGNECVLEHHSAVRSQKKNEDSSEEDEDTSDRLRLLAENWDVPLVVTTSVQFFESLFGNKSSVCRKLHNVARSVVIFDEAQTLPSHLLAPCLEAMKVLQRDYGCTLVLCTATQPALVKTEEFEIGWREEELHSLLGHEMERELQNRMKRVRLEELGALDLQQLTAHVRAQSESSCLIIVNQTRQAQHLFSALKESGVPPEHLFHLSARMCPEHRDEVRERIDKRLKAGEPVLLVATRVVEAGVDLSFPVVYRDRAGLDSVAQAAGRCNRHGENPHGGKVYVFEALDYEIPAVLDDMKTAARSARDVLAAGRYEDMLAPEAVQAFFECYYGERGRQTGWDKTGIHEMPSILSGTTLPAPSSDMYRGLSLATIASAFHLIEPGQRRIMIPWGEEGEEVLKKIDELQRAGILPDRKLYQRIQRLSVSVYEHDWQRLREKGLVELLADDSVAVIRAWDGVYDAELGFLPVSTYDPNKQNYIF